MKFILAFALIITGFAFAFGQNEQAAILSKTFGYKDWTYKNLKGNGETNLRQFAQGKKLVMVVYWAPWCPNWRHDVGFVQEMHDKYAKDGLAVIGIGEYDPVDRMKQSYEQNKMTFPSVYESAASAERTNTVHYAQRIAAGDTRRWGSPWYVFLEPGRIEASGDVIENTPFVVNGELIRPDAEKFIREKLGLGGSSTIASAAGEIEVCDPANGPVLSKP